MSILKVHLNIYKRKVLLLCLVLCTTKLLEIQGIPVNFVNSNRNYHDNHANKPLLPNQLPPQQQQLYRGLPHLHQSQQKQPSHSNNPEMEDFERLYTNQNQFKRHAIVPPDAKVTLGTFQQNPQEQFGKPSVNTGKGGSNFHRHNFEEAHHQPQEKPSHKSRHHPPKETKTEEDFHQRSHRSSQGNPESRRFTQAVPPPLRNNLNNIPREHNFFQQNFDETYQHKREHNLMNNEIFRERNANLKDHHYDDTNAYQSIKSETIPLEQQKRLQQQRETVVDSFLGQNHVHLSKPPQPSAVSVIIQGPDGNSTLFIEYDVSDNDVTDETTVEVEDTENET